MAARLLGMPPAYLMDDVSVISVLLEDVELPLAWNECYDNEDELQSFRHKARQQDKVYEKREESCWILHLRTGIFYPKSHEGVINEVPDGAAIFASNSLLSPAVQLTVLAVVPQETYGEGKRVKHVPHLFSAKRVKHVLEECFLIDLSWMTNMIVTTPVNVTGASVTNTVVNHAEKPKMFFYLRTLNLARFLNETVPQVEPPKEGQPFNAQTTTAKELWESLERKYKTEDAGTKKFYRNLIEFF
ncbi:hypothetical protein Tco_0404056 [Tanacetum coccineum]